MEELTKEQKLKAWEKCLNHFELYFDGIKYSGLCSMIVIMHGKDLLLNTESYYLRDEINKDVQSFGVLYFSGEPRRWLFKIYEYEPRLEYLKNKIKKYS